MSRFLNSNMNDYTTVTGLKSRETGSLAPWKKLKGAFSRRGSRTL